MIQKAPERLTDHGKKILARLRSHAPNWMSRSQIAESIGKKRLTQYDVAVLELLTKMELIESNQKEGKGREGFNWEYRAK
jgi:hypothetical protein